jgi:hypothetical protein
MTRWTSPLTFTKMVTDGELDKVMTNKYRMKHCHTHVTATMLVLIVRDNNCAEYKDTVSPHGG